MDSLDDKYYDIYRKDKPLYYRRKVMLALLQTFNKQLGNTEFQKYLFLYTRKQDTPAYDFVPYKFGCYSFQSIFDREALIHHKILLNDKNSWTLISDVDFVSQLEDKDKNNLREIKEGFGNYSLNNLIKYIYEKYPYYAMRSEIASKYLHKAAHGESKAAVSEQAANSVYTIGYEGSSIEYYLNRLIKNDIKMVVDVRYNPLSMKKGFSKNLLKSVLNKMKIEYSHFHELGIPSILRQEYLKPNDTNHKELFDLYKKEILPKNRSSLDKIVKLVGDYGKIALTCFEKDFNYCHRSIIANFLCDSVNSPIHL